METIFSTITEKLVVFTENVAKEANGNKAAGARARKASLELEKLLKEYRKASIEASRKPAE